MLLPPDPAGPVKRIEDAGKSAPYKPSRYRPVVVAVAREAGATVPFHPDVAPRDVDKRALAGADDVALQTDHSFDRDLVWIMRRPERPLVISVDREKKKKKLWFCEQEEKRRPHQNSTIMPCSSLSWAFHLTLKHTSWRSVWLNSGLKNGYMDGPLIQVRSATLALT